MSDEEFEFGRKPLKKILIGDDAPRWLPVAMKKLRDLYLAGPPPLQAVIEIDNVSIFVQRLEDSDQISITVTTGGYFVTLTFQMYKELFSIEQFGLSFDVVVRFKAKKLAGPWKRVGTRAVFRDEWPAGVINSFTDQDADSVRAVAEASGWKPIFGFTEFKTFPYHGEFLEVTPHINDPVNLAFSTNEEQTVIDFSASADGVNLRVPLQVGDFYALNNSEHETLPVFIQGAKAFYSIFYDPGNNQSNSRKFVVYYGETDPVDFGTALIPSVAAYTGRPTMVNLTPYTVVGFQQPLSSAYYSLEHPLFFVSEDAGRTLRRISNSDFITALIVHPTTVGVTWLPIGATQFLFIADRPGPGSSFFNFRVRDVYRSTIHADDVGQELVLSIPAIGGTISALNLGGDALAIFLLNALLTDIGGQVIGYASYRWLSFDNGKTWGEALPLAMPRAIPAVLTGPIQTTLYSVFVGEAFSPGVSDGAIYALSSFIVTDTTGQQTDVVLCKSVDQGGTWETVATVAPLADFPDSRYLYRTESQLILQNVTPNYPKSGTITPVGTKASPLPIDPIHPYRCDDSFLTPTTWLLPS